MIKRILLVTQFFYPGFRAGGPVRSLVNFVNSCPDNLEVDVYTSDRDLHDSHSYTGVSVNTWGNRFSRARVFYSSRWFFFTSFFKSQSSPYDVIYLNSFFNFKFSILILIWYKLGLLGKVRIIISPRGELTSGALSLKSFKKAVYIYMFKKCLFDDVIIFNFTSELEKKESLDVLPGVTCDVVPNMHEPPPNHILKDKQSGFLELVFLSRISPKKNLICVLKTLKQIDSGLVNFQIVGAVDDDEYWRDCERLIADLPQNITVSVLGAANRSEVTDIFAAGHAFILPTLSENYGHAIVEAMVGSTVVLISDQTPWTEVSNHGGFVGRPNDISFFRESINEIVRMNSDEFNAYTRRSHGFCLDILNKNETLVYKLLDNM